MTVSISKGNFGYRGKTTRRDTAGRPYKDEDRDQGDVPPSQGAPAMAYKPPETWRDSWNRCPLTALRGTNPTDTFILDFLLPEP